MSPAMVRAMAHRGTTRTYLSSSSLSFSWPRAFFLAWALLLAGCATSSNPNRQDNNGSDGGSSSSADASSRANVCDPNPCFSGVECSEGAIGFVCGSCPAGLEGDGQDCMDTDGCVGSPCYPGVTCADEPAPGTGATCGACPTGLSGNGRVCNNVDECAGNPCFSGVTCVDKAPPETGYTCGTCPTGMEGDGLSCTDIDGCAGAPCFGGVSCTDAIAPLTGFSCGVCPPGTTGDGTSCSLLCNAVSSIACGGTIASSNTSLGSANQIDNWACSSTTHTGSEIVYQFTPDGTGIATARLSGLSDNLDLMVIKDASTGNLCDPLDTTVCVPGGLSNNTGTANEEIRWDATIGTTYYIIVDGVAGANSSFSLTVLSATEDFLLNEIAYGTDDFVELRNHGACTADFGGLSLLHKASLDAVPHPFTFPSNSSVMPSAVLRWVESGSGPYLANEINAGASFFDVPAGAGSTALCDGACDTTTCSNLLDYVARDDNTADTSTPGGPPCASMVGGPINSINQAGASVSLRRAAFAGSVGQYKATDWIFGISTRN